MKLKKKLMGMLMKQIKKYLKQSEYATPQQALKFKKQVEAKDIPDEMKDGLRKTIQVKIGKKI